MQFTPGGRRGETDNLSAGSAPVRPYALPNRLRTTHKDESGLSLIGEYGDALIHMHASQRVDLSASAKAGRSPSRDLCMYNRRLASVHGLPKFWSMPTTTGQRTWEEICADPILRNLPYKIETNARGQIVMSPPARNEHSKCQQRIASLLECLLPEGEVFPEAATDTEDGTKAADVAWTTREHARAEIKHASWQRSPQIIVEVWSPHNTDAEMSERRVLFFGAGASEFWTCDLDGRMRFWTHDGEIAQSRLCPGFPRAIALFG